MDFELLDGIDPNKTDPCTLQFLAAPICLLYKNLANKMVPIAIQVGCCLALLLRGFTLRRQGSGRRFPGWLLRPPGKKVLCQACPKESITELYQVDSAVHRGRKGPTSPDTLEESLARLGALQRTFPG